jgi:hypothetical protein
MQTMKHTGTVPGITWSRIQKINNVMYYYCYVM